jgi:hypothetical protein
MSVLYGKAEHAVHVLLVDVDSSTRGKTIHRKEAHR